MLGFHPHLVLQRRALYQNARKIVAQGTGDNPYQP